MLTELSLRIGTSRGRDTHGYTMVTLVVNSTGKCYRACGGGYDMHGTVLADYLEETYQDRLQTIAREALSSDRADKHSQFCHFEGDLYGIALNLSSGEVLLTGGVGKSQIIRIAKKIGLSIVDRMQRTSRTYRAIGYLVTDSGMPVAGAVVPSVAKTCIGDSDGGRSSSRRRRTRRTHSPQTR